MTSHRSANVTYADLLRLRRELADRDLFRTEPEKEDTMSFTPKGLLDAITAAADEETKRQEAADGPTWPGCVVKLVGIDGNAFAILAAVRGALARYMKTDGRFSYAEINREVERFTSEAMSGDYDHLLQVCMKWVTVE